MGVSFILLFSSLGVAASIERIDVNSGVSFPADANSTFSAIYGRGNPGALKNTVGTLDVKVGFENKVLGGEVVYTESVEAVGYHVSGGVSDINKNYFFASGGLGFAFCAFGVGAGVLYSEVTKTAEIDLGIHWGGREGFAAGLTVLGILHSSARSWAMGVGYREPGNFLFAVDAVLYPVRDGHFNDIIYIDPMVTLEWIEHLTMGMGYMFNVSGPSVKAFGGLHGEVNLWLSSIVGLNYKYQNGVQEHTVSLKLVI